LAVLEDGKLQAVALCKKTVWGYFGEKHKWLIWF